MPWPEPGWTPIQPFPFAEARRAFVGMTSDAEMVSVRYFKRPDGTVVAAVTFGPRSEGAPGRVHGGAILTALDEALGAAAWVEGIPCFTVRLETEFRRGVPVGAQCLVTTRLRSTRHGLADVEGELADASGAVLASAKARFKRLSEEAQRQLLGRAA